jgi:hypothetical protein
MGIVDTLRNGLARRVLAPELQELQAARQAIGHVLERLPVAYESLDLAEMDSRTLHLMSRHLRDIPLWAVSQGAGELTHHERLRAIDWSRYMYRVDPLTKRSVNTLTEFAFARPMEITGRDKAADAIWTAFETADANTRWMDPHRMPEMSRILLRDGEFLAAFFVSRVDGSCILRRLPTEEVVEFVTDPEDRDTVLFYKRQYTVPGETAPRVVYYPDATVRRYAKERLDTVTLPRGAVRADRQNEATDVIVVPGLLEPMGRGVPLMYCGAPWVNVYKSFLEDRSQIVKATASVVDTITTQGGSRAVDLMRARLQSTLADGAGDYTAEHNPAPVAGSIWVGNAAQKRTRLPLGTAASDAKIDGDAFVAQTGLSAGLGPEWYGRGQEYMETLPPTVQKVFEAYRTLWAGIFNEYGRVVFWAIEEYGGQQVADKRLDVSGDPLVTMNIRDLASAMSLLVDRQLVPFQTAMLKALQTLGVENAQELVMEHGAELEARYEQMMQAIPSAAEPVRREGDGEGHGVRSGGHGQRGGQESRDTQLGTRPGSEKRTVLRTR